MAGRRWVREGEGGEWLAIGVMQAGQAIAPLRTVAVSGRLALLRRKMAATAAVC
jgi:hypothetical protein